ncbi:MAG TPA: hypothetical protein VHB20_08265 [Verrucomicrobiae bacterium]|jgi:hypothetical protein|nr:hypothetical protein [Verrucomicrobiae bacterium]
MFFLMAAAALGAETSAFLSVKIAADHPGLETLAVDSLGRTNFPPLILRPHASQPSAVSRPGLNRVEYRSPSLTAESTPRWAIEARSQEIRFVSHWTPADPPEPLVLDFDPEVCKATLLGLFDTNGGIKLPAILHLPGRGSLRITADKTAPALGYDATLEGGGFVRVTFPGATSQNPSVAYRLAVTAIYPAIPSLPTLDTDPRFDGFRRNWLNIFQLHPRRRVLANNTGSDNCAFCYYMYADIARQTPALAPHLTALDIVRQTLDAILRGVDAYGMPGHGAFPEFSADTYPSLLIAAADYVEGARDHKWLAQNYPALRAWADKMLATDHSGDGLIEYTLSGNAGSWPEQLKFRPANWWDTIGFGHQDAYANALAYRALGEMSKLAESAGQPADALRFQTAAHKLHDAYFKTFFDPATGVLAGWRSADGQLHDYYFLWVNGIAIDYGLVPPTQGPAIMDRLLRKMRDVNYTNFALGLPGNLVPVARRDYVDLNPRFGGGRKDDNSDGFQRYENGGATACYAYFTLAALYDIGRPDDADRIFFPMLAAFGQNGFDGRGPNGLTKDWKAWDGTCWGYEGLLVDNYYTLLALLKRQIPVPAPGD